MADKSRSSQQGGQKTAQNAKMTVASGLSRERIRYLCGLREKISTGFYNTEPVLEDLSHSFTKAVDALIM
jgi:hypothetical protein